MKKQKSLFVFLSCFIIGIFCFCILQQSEEQTVQTSGVALSNKSIGWGIKRVKDHNQPELGSENKQLIEQYHGMAMGNGNSKQVYLTFDEGYEAGYTEKILEVLKNNNVKACFFITAHYLNTQPELVQRMIQEGHIVRQSYGKS